MVDVAGGGRRLAGCGQLAVVGMRYSGFATCALGGLAMAVSKSDGAAWRVCSFCLSGAITTPVLLGIPAGSVAGAEWQGWLMPVLKRSGRRKSRQKRHKKHAKKGGRSYTISDERQAINGNLLGF
ncbi:hypothetical protein KCP76_00695 [Salmonella enterica subsp. enterica serovar Weltevreden]|nr:hypothetical protein KCP76_00695 [Salmonella enterica subsp. enterica serovar Weltevreden]